MSKDEVQKLIPPNCISQIHGCFKNDSVQRVFVFFFFLIFSSTPSFDSIFLKINDWFFTNAFQAKGSGLVIIFQTRGSLLQPGFKLPGPL